MQVLVLAAQNSVDFEDIGVATAGAALFRSLGALSASRSSVQMLPTNSIRIWEMWRRLIPI